MKERLIWIGHILRRKDGRLPKIVLSGQPYGAKRKRGGPWLEWGNITKKDLREIGTPGDGVKRKALN